MPISAANTCMILSAPEYLSTQDRTCIVLQCEQTTHSYWSSNPPPLPPGFSTSYRTPGHWPVATHWTQNCVLMLTYQSPILTYPKHFASMIPLAFENQPLCTPMTLISPTPPPPPNHTALSQLDLSVCLHNPAELQTEVNPKKRFHVKGF